MQHFSSPKHRLNGSIMERNDHRHDDQRQIGVPLGLNDFYLIYVSFHATCRDIMMTTLRLRGIFLSQCYFRKKSPPVVKFHSRTTFCRLYA